MGRSIKKEKRIIAKKSLISKKNLVRKKKRGVEENLMINKLTFVS
jgi:hypothetical protein